MTGVPIERTNDFSEHGPYNSATILRAIESDDPVRSTIIIEQAEDYFRVARELRSLQVAKSMIDEGLIDPKEDIPYVLPDEKRSEQ